MLENAGFRVEVREQTPRWEEFQRGVHERVLARQDDLNREMGKSAAKVWIRLFSSACVMSCRWAIADLKPTSSAALCLPRT